MPALRALTELPWPWVVILGLGVTALILAAIISVVSMRRLTFGVGCLVGSDSFNDGVDRWTIRLTLHAEREQGLVSAHLMTADGFPLLMTPLPLGWSNHADKHADLGPVLPVSVFCGFLDVNRETGDFMYVPLGPGFPQRHAHSPIRSVGSQLTLRIRIIDQAERKHRDISVSLSVKEGVLCCNAQIRS